jgi:D-glutamate cyclase
MSDARLTAMRDLIQHDVGGRGLRTDPHDNLITACPDDFAAACRSIAETSEAALAIVTGFFIPRAEPPCGETDGPLGALFLARALEPLGIRASLVTDSFCKRALQEGVKAAGLQDDVLVVSIPPKNHPWDAFLSLDWKSFLGGEKRSADPRRMTHLVALERCGPSHTPESLRLRSKDPEGTGNRFLQEVPEHQDRYHNMRGEDATECMAPAHLLFEDAVRRNPPLTTIGIGDGGNEIGMGKIPWDTIRRNVPNGGLIACRVPTDHLIVAGVSNWGAYALAAGVRLLRGAAHDPTLFDVEREHELLRIMVQKGPLVDGVTGQRIAQVDGLPFDRYAQVLGGLEKILTS